MATEDERVININLVCQVEKYECIYDFTRDDYCNRQLSQITWAEVGNKLGMTGADAKNRWANLRTVYVRRRRKLPKSGSGATKPYYLDKYMKFLIPTLKLKAKSTGSNLSTVPKNQQPRKKVSCDIEPYVEKQEAAMDDGEDIDDETTGFEADINAGEESFEPLPKQPCKNKSCKSVKPNNVDETFMEYFAGRKNKVEIHVDPEDPRRMFLLSLLPEVNELPEYQFKTFKRRVLALLDEMEESRSVSPTAASTKQ